MRKIGNILLIAIFVGLTLHMLVCAYYYFSTKDLILAIENEDTFKVEQLLKEGTDPNMLKVPASKFWTFLEYSPDCPLSIACKTANFEIVEMLVTHGAKVEPPAEAGFTPLQATLLYYQPDDPEIVSFLLKNGAKTEWPQNEKAAVSAARMRPCVYDKTKANGTVFSSEYDESTAIGITKIVGMLCDLTDIDVETSTALLTASVQQENLFLTRYLLTKGCDPTKADANGKKPLDYAAETNNTELIRILIEAYE